MKDFLKSVTYWKAAIALCATYSLINGATTWIGITDSYTGDQWAQTSAFEKYRLYVLVFISIASTVAAFLDKTVAKITQENNNVPRKPDNENAS